MISKIHSFQSVSSTNKIAFALAGKGALHGEVVLAESQTAGRGRLGKNWKSPSGKGLYFSLIVRPDIRIEDYPTLTMTTGLAVALALEKHCGLKILLKWPNDIMVLGQKCAGILCEASFTNSLPSAHFAVIGVGLNVNTEPEDFPFELRNKATSLYIATKRRYELDSLLHQICESILGQICRLEQDGFAGILQEWGERDFLRGKKLEWISQAGEIVTGIAEGPEESGRLMVRDDQGELHEVLSGDVTLARDSR